MFYNCTNLERCIVKYGTKQYGQQIFDNCQNLKQIYIPDSVQLMQANSIPCSTIVYSSRNLKLDNDKIDLSNNTVYPNYKITNGVLLEYQSETGYDYLDENEKRVIDVPNAVEKISRSVFFYNKNVDKVILSDYLDVIGDSAFMDCSVNEIVMPKTMTSIGSSAFNRTRITYMEIPFGITKIESYFLHGSPIRAIFIPDSVTEIGYRAFRVCYGLKSIYIPDSVTKIDTCAFESSSYPITLFGNNNTYLSQYVNENSERNGNNVLICRLGYNIVNKMLISYTGSDQNVQVPFGLGLTDIAEEAFKNNTLVESVAISLGVTSIGAECFSGCTSLTSIYVPDDVASIGSNAFDGIQNITVYCNSGSYVEGYCISNNISVNTDYGISDGILNKYSGSATNVVIPSNLCISEIGTSAFCRNERITSVKIPEGVYSIDFGFVNCPTLESVFLPSTLRSIKHFAFSRCSNLISINIPAKLKNIESYAFSNCSSLKSIDLSNVESISYNAFDGCTNLTDIILGTSLTSIGEDAFKDCPNLVINCYINSYAYQYAINNEIPYVLLNGISTTMFSSRLFTNADVLENNITSENLEEYMNCNSEEELCECIQAKYNGEITENNIDDILAYIVNNM